MEDIFRARHAKLGLWAFKNEKKIFLVRKIDFFADSSAGALVAARAR